MVRRLSRADAATLVADWSHAVEVVPTHRRGFYRLTARGWVGSFATPNRTWQIAPKLGWEAAARLLTGGRLVGSAVELGGGLRSALASRLAVLMAERRAAGLVRGYDDRPEFSAIVRGRIDFAAARPPVVGFAQVVDDFTTDQPWNGWPVAVAGRLLVGPLDSAARAELEAATNGFGGVRPHPSPPAVHQTADRRLAGYRPLLDWCGLIAEALAGGGLLVNLERLFEAHLGRLFARPHRSHVAVPQQELLVRGPAGVPGVELRPDLVVLDSAGRPAGVWDVKWKPLPPAGPRPDDLHQALGYAAALGVTACGLIYPGRRFTCRRYHTPGGVTVTVATCRLTGRAAQITRAGDSLRRLALRS